LPLQDIPWTESNLIIIKDGKEDIIYFMENETLLPVQKTIKTDIMWRVGEDAWRDGWC
jgi:hypothetical protein